jgi:asparagine synthetase A
MAGTAKRVEQMFHLKKQLELTHQLDFLKYPNHPAIVKHEIPLSIGGGMGSHAR